jgi:hypothetical protein
MSTSSKPETSRGPEPVDAATEETQTSKHTCWSGEHCSTSRFSLRRLFWRRSWNCGDEKTSSPSPTTIV